MATNANDTMITLSIASRDKLRELATSEDRTMKSVLNRLIANEHAKHFKRK